MSTYFLGDDVWEYNAPQYVDFAAGEDDPNADAWFGKVLYKLLVEIGSRNWFIVCTLSL